MLSVGLAASLFALSLAAPYGDYGYTHSPYKAKQYESKYYDLKRAPLPEQSYDYAPPPYDVYQKQYAEPKRAPLPEQTAHLPPPYTYGMKYAEENPVKVYHAAKYESYTPEPYHLRPVSKAYHSQDVHVVTEAEGYGKYEKSADRKHEIIIENSHPEKLILKSDDQINIENARYGKGFLREGIVKDNKEIETIEVIIEEPTVIEVEVVEVAQVEKKSEKYPPAHNDEQQYSGYRKHSDSAKSVEKQVEQDEQKYNKYNKYDKVIVEDAPVTYAPVYTPEPAEDKPVKIGYSHQRVVLEEQPTRTEVTYGDKQVDQDEQKYNKYDTYDKVIVEDVPVTYAPVYTPEPAEDKPVKTGYSHQRVVYDEPPVYDGRFESHVEQADEGLPVEKVHYHGYQHQPANY